MCPYCLPLLYKMDKRMFEEDEARHIPACHRILLYKRSHQYFVALKLVVILDVNVTIGSQKTI